MSKKDKKGWTKATAMRVVSSIRDNKAKQAAANYGNAVRRGVSDRSLQRLKDLDEALASRNPQARMEWRLNQLAALGITVAK